MMLANLAMYGVLALSLLGTAAGVVHVHDNRIRAELVASESAARLVTAQADNARKVVALEQRATVAESQAASVVTIKESIARAPASTACNRSGPVRAALDGLRQPTGRH